MSITINNNFITFNTSNGQVTVSFHRTLRVPDDGKKYPLPASLGRFPIRNVRDFEGKIPDEWYRRGGVIIPMHYLEALWINFDTHYHTPHAIKVGVGNVNVISGEKFIESLVHSGDNKYDYMVSPKQPWLDGIKISPDGEVRQFVATRMGDGKSVEAQITGEEKYGGFQIAVYPAKKDRFTIQRDSSDIKGLSSFSVNNIGEDYPMMASVDSYQIESTNYAYTSTSTVTPVTPDSFMGNTRSVKRLASTPEKKSIGAMNIGAGGVISQKIYTDPYGIDTWDQDNVEKLFINIISAYDWYLITGEKLTSPITRNDYIKNNVPFFHLEDYFKQDVAMWKKMEGVKSVTTIAARDGEVVPDNKTINLSDDQPVLKKVYPQNNIIQNDW